MARKPSHKQQKVIDQLIFNPSLKECCEVTGVSYDYVRQLHTKTHILELIDEGRKQLADKAVQIAAVDAAWVLQEQRKSYERCKVDNDWKLAAPAAKLLESIGRHRLVDAFVRNDQMPTMPASGEWTLKVVHMTKDDYDNELRPPIEHQP